MALVPWKKREAWSPFSELEDLQREMNRLFGSSLAKWDDSPATMLASDWNPSIDIKDKKDKYVVKAELPGMEKEDVNISLDDNILSIRGEKKQETEKDEDGKYYRECAYGSFQRSVRLGENVDSENVDASFKNGVLTLLLPKKEPDKAKSTEIKIK